MLNLELRMAQKTALGNPGSVPQKWFVYDDFREDDAIKAFPAKIRKTEYADVIQLPSGKCTEAVCFSDEPVAEVEVYLPYIMVGDGAEIRSDIARAVERLYRESVAA